MGGVIVERWREALRVPSFRAHFFGTAALLTVTGIAFSRFVRWVETRPGVLLDDPLLEILPLHNLTWLIFALIYAAIAAGLWTALPSPPRVVLLFQLWTGTTILRGLMMYLTPLDDPTTAIILVDPVTTFLFRSETAPTKDLFFSGHTSTFFILFLGTAKPALRRAFLVGTVIIGLSVLVQRVHYTIDVVAAPFFVYVVYRWARLLPGSMVDEQPPSSQPARPQ